MVIPAGIGPSWNVQAARWATVMRDLPALLSHQPICA